MGETDLLKELSKDGFKIDLSVDYLYVLGFINLDKDPYQIIIRNLGKFCDRNFLLNFNFVKNLKEILFVTKNEPVPAESRVINGDEHFANLGLVGNLLLDELLA